LAARPPTLPAAIVPVLVGSAVAWAREVFRWDSFFLAVGGALAIQVGANFANDASDAHRGADPGDRVGPVRMVATGVITARQMWTATWAAVVLAAVCGIGLAYIAGPLILVIGAVSILTMLGYVGGPYPYGYHGLGEVFVFCFFGLVATVGSRFAHDGQVEGVTWLMAVPVGLLAAAILVINNLRDVETDARAGKRTLAVILGPERTRRLYAGLVYGSLVVIAILAIAQVIPPWTALTLVTVPIAHRLVRLARTAADPRALIPALGGTALLHLGIGLILAFGTALEPVA
jgi:1,4-dihydroxy-2-naphthoate octaprenyltransferase